MQLYAVTVIGHWPLGLVLLFSYIHCINPASGC